MSDGQSAHRRTQRVPLSASSARLPADPQVLRAAGRDAARRSQRHAAARHRGDRGLGATIDTRERAAAARHAHGGSAGARQQLAAGQLSGR